MKVTRVLTYLILPTACCFSACSGDDSDGDASMGGSTGSGGNDGTGGGGAVVELYDCQGLDVDNAVLVEGAIDTDTTWSGTLLLSGDVTVRGGTTLTIEPGTDIIVEADSSFTVGWNSGASTIKAEGAPTSPIRFCGRNREPGFWNNFVIGSAVTSDSIISNTLVADAGSEDFAVSLDTGVTIKNLQVRGSGSAGVEAQGFNDDSSKLTVEGSEGAAVVLTDDDAINNFPLLGSFIDNADNRAIVRFTAIDADTVFHNIGIPYLQEDPITSRADTTVEFEAGVDYQFAADSGIEFGWNSSESEILVKGTEDAPVVFHGETEGAGFWEGVTIGVNVLTSSKISYLEVSDAGGNGEYALEVNAAVELQNVSLSDNETGMYVDDQGLKPASAMLNISGTSGIPLEVEPDAVITIPAGGDFTGNDEDVIEILAGAYTVAGTVQELGVPYLTNSITTRADSEMTIEAGVTFLMKADSSFEFGWNSASATVTAVGTSAAPIVFKGASETAGYWEDLTIGVDVVSSSQFEYVEVRHGGGNGVDAAFVINKAAGFDLSNSVIADSAAYGLEKHASDSTDYTANNTFSGNASGDIAP